MQRRLSEVTAETRDMFINNPDSLERYLRTGEINSIIDEPWRMKIFFGTAVNRRVDSLVESDSILSSLQVTRNNAPQDYIGPDNIGFDITGGSKSSITSHFKRPEIDYVITYDSIPDSFGHEWAKRFIDD